MRPYAARNWIGLWSLFMRELRRSTVKSWGELLFGPPLMGLLFAATFGIAAGSRDPAPLGLDMIAFLAPGLAFSAAGNFAFAGGCFPIVMGKLEGTIADELMAPLSPGELALGHALGGAVAGIACGLAVLLVLIPFAPLTFPNPLLALAHLALGALALSTIGAIAGLWARRWDDYGAVDTLFLQPLMMLSGTFFPLATLPEPLPSALALLPAFPAIDGMRQGLAGAGEAPVATSLLVLAATCLGLLVALRQLFASGWRTKS
ncbi:MAG: ABC transporter permease [Alphaproteobacteria bacterium]|nr:ABC transporter permease [Alphaproteobacteria bacterium]